MKSLIIQAKQINPWIVKHRHEFHQYPELAFDLPKTTEHILHALAELNIQSHILPEGGILAKIGKVTGKSILLRADMDALPIQECSGVDFSSKIDGKMHACGHDTHMSMLLGAAKLLKNHEDELAGTVILCFQPAEEAMQGAQSVVRQLDDSPDFGFALHIFTTNCEANGTIVCPYGPFMASSDVFRVDVKGVGAHGSAPHLGKNPIYTAMRIAQAYSELINFELAPIEPCALTVCQFNGGTTYNVIPEFCYFSGTLRMMNEDRRSFIKQRMEEILQNLCKANELDGMLTWERSVPVTCNDETLAKKSQQWLADSGMENIAAPSTVLKMGSEDFSEFGKKMPIVLFNLMSRSPENAHYDMHNPKVLFDDSILWRGSAAYAQVAMCFLNDQ